MPPTMLLTKDAFVGTIYIDGVTTDPKSALFHANRLTNVNMLDWAHVFRTISIKIVTSEFNTIYVHKDCSNNLIIDGYEFLQEKIRSLAVEYTLPTKIKNNYDIQDIIASELIVYRYKLKRVNNNIVYLEAVVE